MNSAPTSLLPQEETPSSLVAYKNISRRYRPQRFSEVVGQEVVITTLQNALRLGKVSSAYLFCGSRGVGKTTIARLLAKALNCQHPNDQNEPCNSCTTCREISAGHSLDVLEIDGASHRGIDDVRQINETVGYAPAHGRYKIYIIDEVHMLTKEAFNALLKTLEEPPLHVKFFFATTEAHKLPLTVISRCQRFDLRRLPPQVIGTKLAHIAASLEVACEEEAIHLLSEYADGSLRDGESLLDQLLCTLDLPITASKVCSALGLPSRELLFGLDQAVHKGELAYALTAIREIQESGTDLGHFAEALLVHYRTLLSCHLVGNPTSIWHPTLAQRYEQSARLYTQQECLTCLELTLRFLQTPSRLPCQEIALEALLLQILRVRGMASLPELIQRLAALEKGLSTTALAPPIVSPPPQETQMTATKVDKPRSEEKPSNVLTDTPSKKIELTELAPSTPLSGPLRARYDTMVQFAAVTFDGIAKR